MLKLWVGSSQTESPYILKDESDADIRQGTPTDTPSPYRIESGWSHPIMLAQTRKARFFCPTLLIRIYVTANMDNQLV